MASADRSKGNLAVNIGEELLDRINKVAKALGKSQAQFVREKLDELTKAHGKDVEEITKREQKIAERESGRSVKR
jgi:predicted DNA-binding protein